MDDLIFACFTHTLELLWIKLVHFDCTPHPARSFCCTMYYSPPAGAQLRRRGNETPTRGPPKTLFPLCVFSLPNREKI